MKKNDPFVKKFVPSDNAEIALHNLMRNIMCLSGSYRWLPQPAYRS